MPRTAPTTASPFAAATTTPTDLTALDLDLTALGELLRALDHGEDSGSVYPCSGVAVALRGQVVHLRCTHSGEVLAANPRRTYDLSAVPPADRPRALKSWLSTEVVSFATSVREALKPKPEPVAPGKSAAEYWAAT